MNKLLIIDAVNFLFRAYYGIAPMTNQEGVSTNAIFGFIRSIHKLMNDFPTEHVVVVFDGINNKKSRSDLYAQYKSHRKEMPADLVPQLQFARQWCELAGLPFLSVEGVEADDTIGSIAVWAADQGTEVRLCSSDKDLCQLISNQIHLLNPSKDDLEMDTEKVKEVFGVYPHQMIDYLALVGDSSDNIPGLEGFGPKTAVVLLEQFGTLQAILENPDQVAGKKKQETLKENKEIALLSQKLATISLTVDFPHDPLFFLKKDPSHELLKSFYHHLQLFSFLKEIKASVLQEPVVTQYHLVETVEELESVCQLLEKHTSVCLDTETTSLNSMQSHIVGIGLTATPAQGWYIPFNGSVDPVSVKNRLSLLLKNPSLHFYGHNIKFDLHALLNEQLPLPQIGFDTMIASYLLTPQNHRHNLDELSLSYFDFHKTPITDLIGKGKAQKSMQEVPLEQITPYCCEDVDYTARLKIKFQEEIETQQLHDTFYHLELPLIPVLLKMERRGIFVDTDSLKQLGSTLEKEQKKLEHQIYQLTGETFNLNSPKQLGFILFDKMKIAPLKKNATGYSTNAAVLEELKETTPIAALILEYRSLEKLRSTYLEPLPSQIHPVTARIHPTFNQSVAATGRLSCQDPNLQNIPIKSLLGKKIREAFRPEDPHFRFLSADYSQIELRLLAHLSQDPMLMKAFNEGEDVHAYTASVVFNVPLKEVSQEMRQRAKAVNFGVLYGQQAFGLSQGLGISYHEASQFIETYFDRYKNVRDFLESCKESARKTGYAITMTGRKRPIPDLTNKNPIIRAASERLAINTPLQGTAADLIKLAMIQIDRELISHPKCHMLLQIHDELLFEAPQEEILSLSQQVKVHMEQVMQLKVPLEVHISIGKNWGEC
ncbi:MAG: DNA polymerase I [Candidatus Rhabdochlamydia sp.]